ncbi:stage II sporulation protein M [Natronobacterium texcoconense]|uniref:Stage II sporulation protein M n=1 Tax=Natronobacterium texcoconense TaxID=1095778 RepID=A0A1H1I940_NATTX|nr:stage II sporulation protein M [Natronobacterium texcoconense]SDR34263.1 Stage II sporulation protein M [Natronobacterium texcoconense]
MSRSLSDAVASVGAVFRNRPSDFLPVYLLGAATPAIARVVPFLAAVVSYLYLLTTGRLDAALDQLAAIDTSPPDPEAEPEAFEAWAEGLVPVMEQLMTPAVAALFLVSLAGMILILIVLSPIVSAAQLSASYGRLRDERGLVAGIAGVRRYSLRFLALYLLEVILWLIIGAGFVAVMMAIVGGFAVAGVPILGVLVALLASFVAIAAFAVVRAVFAFAPVAVVVDDAGVFGSLSATGSFVRSRPVGALFYYAISVGSIVSLVFVSGILAFIEAAAAVSLLTVFLLWPALDLLKTAIYCDYRGRLTPPPSPERSVRTQFRDGVERGWSEMTSFVRATPITHAVVVALAVVSFWAGWRAADPYTGIGALEASIGARLEGHIPPAAALEFFGNNWMVAIMTAFSGLALVVPAIISLLFNGVFMGVLSRFEVEPMELLAFVIPHGIFEIPAILIASALGISLGVTFWRAARGKISRVAFADELERAFWVLVGVGILLAIAAFVEGFVSPYYYQPFF